MLLLSATCAYVDGLLRRQVLQAGTRVWVAIDAGLINEMLTRLPLEVLVSDAGAERLARDPSPAYAEAASSHE